VEFIESAPECFRGVEDTAALEAISPPIERWLASLECPIAGLFCLLCHFDSSLYAHALRLHEGSEHSPHWFNPNAFAVPAAGTWGDLGRGEYTGPGLADTVRRRNQLLKGVGHRLSPTLQIKSDGVSTAAPLQVLQRYSADPKKSSNHHVCSSSFGD
jgi:hypothetical protein